MAASIMSTIAAYGSERVNYVVNIVISMKQAILTNEILLRKVVHLPSFHAKAELPIALKVKGNIQFFTLFLMVYSMLRHKP